MKKFLLMFAAVAAIAFVGCKTETKPAEEAPVEEAPVAEYTVDGVAADLLNCADEAQAVTLLDGIKAKAEELLAGGDQAGYFNIINILKTVWDNNKDAILAKIPSLAEKITGYIDVPEEMKVPLTLPRMLPVLLPMPLVRRLTLPRRPLRTLLAMLLTLPRIRLLRV